MTVARRYDDDNRCNGLQRLEPVGALAEDVATAAFRKRFKMDCLALAFCPDSHRIGRHGARGFVLEGGIELYSRRP
jgi:hypothetical protein